MKNIQIFFSFCQNKKIQNKILADYSQRGHFRSSFNLKIGDNVHDFEVIERKSFSDFNIQYASLLCKSSGLKWHHFDCQQQQNSLGMIFDCNQCPHMIKLALQKMLLCGSKGFPIRDPFKQMTLRSFNPQDYTFVEDNHIFMGFQTPLVQDHNNLMEVLIQTVCNPLFRKQDFYEMIWRHKIQNNKQELQIGGQLAQFLEQNWFGTNQTKIFHVIQKQLLNKKGINRKQDLITVNYEDIREWHRKLFVPNKTTILTHGDMPVFNTIAKFKKQIEKRSQHWTNLNLSSGLQTPSKQSQQHKNQFLSKTVAFQQLQVETPMILSYKLQDVLQTDKIPLQILSYLLYDMPDSPFMKWNTPQTPYPKLYGYQQTHFNIGITINPKIDQKNSNKIINLSENQILAYQEQIIKQLSNITKQKLPDQLIEQCLLHLEGEYYERDGMKIFSNGCLGVNSIKIDQVFNVKNVINSLLRRYRKQNVFENLIQKYILDNHKYLRIRGKHNPNIYDDYKFDEAYRLRKQLQKMNQQQKQQMKNYESPSILQNSRVLPIIQPQQFQIFQERSPKIFNILNTEIYHIDKCDGVKISLKVDVSDIQQQDIRMLSIICETYPFMGYQGLKGTAYDQYIGFYLRNIQMKYQSCKVIDGMKIFIYLELQFTDRNAEAGFNLFSNIVHDHDHKNIEVIANKIHKKGSQMFHDITDKLIEVHGRHIAGTKSPYAMIEDPIFQARSICNLAAQISKISNPKSFLYSVAYLMHKITKKFIQKHRIKLLIQCKDQLLPKYQRYLQIFLKQYKQLKVFPKIQAINDKGFQSFQTIKYFPNYNDQVIFQAFNIPYYTDLKSAPSTLIISALINHSISQYNPLGGCFLFKGALISYMRGNRKKYLQLQNYYKNIKNIDLNIGKRFVFKKFRRYTAADYFYSAIEAKQARIFKQAVAMTEISQIQDILHKYILNPVKQGKSSMLALGPHIGNYQPMIKRGWSVERSVDDMSMKMQGKSHKMVQIEMSKYLNIY